MGLAFFVANYFLYIAFLQEHYLFYFILLFLTAYFIQLDVKLSLVIIIICSFIFEYLDVYIFYSYLYLDINEFYIYVGGEVIYILSILHAFVFFLGYNRKKYLLG